MTTISIKQDLLPKDNPIFSIEINVSNEEKQDVRKKTSCLKKIKQISTLALGSWGSYYLLDAALANSLVLNTSRHGTDLANYIKIQTSGLDPNYDRKEGSTYGACMAGIRKSGNEEQCHNQAKNDTENYGYFFKDPDQFEVPNEFLKFTYPPLFVRLLPRMHAYLSGHSKGGFCRGAFNTFFSPTLKFRFDPEKFTKNEDGSFTYEYNGKKINIENDPDYDGFAFRTKDEIPANEFLGIFGSLRQGLNSSLPTRIQKNPLKFLYGLLLFFFTIMAAKKTYTYYKENFSKKEKKTDLISKPTNSHLIKQAEIKIVQ